MRIGFANLLALLDVPSDTAEAMVAFDAHVELCVDCRLGVDEQDPAALCPVGKPLCAAVADVVLPESDPERT